MRDGDADVALLPRAYADPLLGTAAATDVVASRFNHLLQSYAFAFAPDDAARQARVERALAPLEENGRLETLRVRWLSSHREFAAEQRFGRGLAREQQRTWGVVAISTVAVLLLRGVAWRRGRRIVAERRRRKAAEQALARAEELLARTFTRSTDPMLVAARGNRHGGARARFLAAADHRAPRAARRLAHRPAAGRPGVIGTWRPRSGRTCWTTR